MGLVDRLKQKHNHKKGQQVWIKVRNIMKYQDHYTFTIPTTSGYDELFRKMTDSHLGYTLNDTGDKLVIITVHKLDSFTIGKLLF